MFNLFAMAQARVDSQLTIAPKVERDVILRIAVFFFLGEKLLYIQWRVYEFKVLPNLNTIIYFIWQLLWFNMERI